MFNHHFTCSIQSQIKKLNLANIYIFQPVVKIIYILNNYHRKITVDIMKSMVANQGKPKPHAALKSFIKLVPQKNIFDLSDKINIDRQAKTFMSEGLFYICVCEIFWLLRVMDTFQCLYLIDYQLTQYLTQMFYLDPSMSG